MYQYRFTIFTSTYNRAHTIHRVWESLNAQTFKNFEWLVFDNKSSDNIKEVLDGYVKEASFPMKVTYNEENIGKHLAMNKAFDMAKGEFFVIADSDDSIMPNALERFDKIWSSIPETERNNFSGINVQCLNTTTGKFVGDPFPEDRFISNNLELKYRYGITGEKWGIIRTDLMSKYRYPEIRSELGYFIDNIIWFGLAKDGYKVLCVNEAMKYYFVDTNNSVTKLKTKNPLRGANVFYYYINWNLNNNLDYILQYGPRKELLRNFVGLVRFGLATDNTLGQIIKNAKNRKMKSLLILILPLAYLMYQFTYKKFKKMGSKASQEN